MRQIPFLLIKFAKAKSAKAAAVAATAAAAAAADATVTKPKWYACVRVEYTHDDPEGESCTKTSFLYVPEDGARAFASLVDDKDIANADAKADSIWNLRRRTAGDDWGVPGSDIASELEAVGVKDRKILVYTGEDDITARIGFAYVDKVLTEDQVNTIVDYVQNTTFVSHSKHESAEESGEATSFFMDQVHTVLECVRAGDVCLEEAGNEPSALYELFVES